MNDISLDRFSQFSLSAPKLAALTKIVAADESLNAALFVEVLTEGCTFAIGASPNILGKGAVEAFVVEFFKGITSLRHELHDVHELGELLVYFATVHYEFKSGSKASLEYANRLHFHGELIDNYKIYIDLSGVKAS